MITEISFSRNFEKQYANLPENIRKKAQAWFFQVQLLGLAEVQKRPGLHDEPLKGSRTGQRSVRLNRAYRLIYWVIENRIRIEVLEVHKHDY
ncbi:hypothetical protein D3C87_144230 [compost metagenome]